MEFSEDDVPCGLVTFRDDGAIVSANATLAKMLGIPKEKLQGQGFESLLNVAGRIFYQTHLAPLLKISGRIEEAHLSMLDAQGEEVPILLNATRLEREIGFLSQAAISPMRRRIRHEEEILAAKRSAETANREKEAANAELRAFKTQLEARIADRTAQLQIAVKEAEGFNYSISHDLRAPIRAVCSTSRILLEEASPQLSEEHRQMLVRQDHNANRLGTLVDELLRLSRLARAEIHRVSLNISAEASAIGASLETPCEIVVQERMTAEGDPGLVRTVLHNLIENACKFSPKGGKVCVGKEGDAFYVQDQGIGFDMQYATKLFLPFERLVTEAQFPGTGIGLANVERIVRRHGGRVWAESEPGQGATFFFTLG